MSRGRKIAAVALGAFASGALLAPLAGAAGSKPTVAKNPSLVVVGSATLHVGSVLDAPLDGTDAKQWTGSPKLGVTWSRCATATSATCSTIAGATKDAYTVAKADVGFYLEAVVTATNSAGSAKVTSPKSALVRSPLVPVNTAVPEITPAGIAPLITASLHASGGTWTGSPTNYDFQWLVCTASHSCMVLSPESGTAGIVTLPHESTLVVSTAYLGETIEVEVAASNKYGASAFTLSAPTKPVSA